MPRAGSKAVAQLVDGRGERLEQWRFPELLRDVVDEGVEQVHVQGASGPGVCRRTGGVGGVEGDWLDRGGVGLDCCGARGAGDQGCLEPGTDVHVEAAVRESRGAVLRSEAACETSRPFSPAGGCWTPWAGRATWLGYRYAEGRGAGAAARAVLSGRVIWLGYRYVDGGGLGAG